MQRLGSRCCAPRAPPRTAVDFSPAPIDFSPAPFCHPSLGYASHAQEDLGAEAKAKGDTRAGAEAGAEVGPLPSRAHARSRAGVRSVARLSVAVHAAAADEDSERLAQLAAAQVRAVALGTKRPGTHSARCARAGCRRLARARCPARALVLLPPCPLASHSCTRRRHNASPQWPLVRPPQPTRRARSRRGARALTRRRCCRPTMRRSRRATASSRATLPLSELLRCTLGARRHWARPLRPSTRCSGRGMRCVAAPRVAPFSDSAMVHNERTRALAPSRCAPARAFGVTGVRMDVPLARSGRATAGHALPSMPPCHPRARATATGQLGCATGVGSDRRARAPVRVFLRRPAHLPGAARELCSRQRRLTAGLLLST